jgi:phage nucleotide-binding protein
MVMIKTTKRDIHWVKMLCYGESGVGKTFMCHTAPCPIIISAEQGLLSLRKFDIPAVEVANLNDVREAYKLITKDDTYSTICIDSLSELSEVLLSEFKADTKDPRQAYGKMADEMAQIVRRFRDIPNKHVYFIAKQNRTTDEVTGKINYGPLIPGKVFAVNLPYFFDIVACLKIGVKDKEEYRYLQTQPSTQYEAKDRSGNLDKVEYPDLTKLFHKITGK